MLIKFSLENYKVFRNKSEISFVASNYDKKTRENLNVFTNKSGTRILKSGVIYGANASGKSKFMEALMFMRSFTIKSTSGYQKGDKIPVEPFKLSSDTENEPSFFEVIFIFNSVTYRYGFELDQDRVSSEWLFRKPKTKEVEIFYRDALGISTHSRSFKKGNIAVKEKMVRDNALLLSVAAQLNDEVSNEVISWFKNLKTISGLNEDGYTGYTITKTKNPNYKAKILDLVKAADLGIKDIKLEIVDTDKLPKGLPEDVKKQIIDQAENENVEFVSDVLTSHTKYNSLLEAYEKVSFSLEEDESSGTKKFFALTGPIIDVLENGYCLVVDELDSKLHPNLVCKIVELFNSKEHNPKNAQLIFNTHDTNLLNSGLFRKDQIWFTAKNKYGEGELYSLNDFDSSEVRSNESFESNYVKGKYGAVPYLDFFNQLHLHENAE